VSLTLFSQGKNSSIQIFLRWWRQIPYSRQYHDMMSLELQWEITKWTRNLPLRSWVKMQILSGRNDPPSDSDSVMMSEIRLSIFWYWLSIQGESAIDDVDRRILLAMLVAVSRIILGRCRVHGSHSYYVAYTSHFGNSYSVPAHIQLHFAKR
jgi:hypothetical protein